MWLVCGREPVTGEYEPIPPLVFVREVYFNVVTPSHKIMENPQIVKSVDISITLN